MVVVADGRIFPELQVLIFVSYAVFLQKILLEFYCWHTVTVLTQAGTSRGERAKMLLSPSFQDTIELITTVFCFI